MDYAKGAERICFLANCYGILSAILQAEKADLTPLIKAVEAFETWQSIPSDEKPKRWAFLFSEASMKALVHVKKELENGCGLENLMYEHVLTACKWLEKPLNETVTLFHGEELNPAPKVRRIKSHLSLTEDQRDWITRGAYKMRSLANWYQACLRIMAGDRNVNLNGLGIEKPFLSADSRKDVETAKLLLLKAVSSMQHVPQILENGRKASILLRRVLKDAPLNLDERRLVESWYKTCLLVKAGSQEVDLSQFGIEEVILSSRSQKAIDYAQTLLKNALVHGGKEMSINGLEAIRQLDPMLDEAHSLLHLNKG